jgi:signal transduction histidine kinase
VLVVAALLATVSPPWQRLLAEQAVPWVPLALAWATVRVLGNARTPRQLQVSAALAAGYLAVIGATAGVPAMFGAAVPLLGGIAASLAARLAQARRDRARADERQRVATQVHDTLGHVLTLLVLHANALVAGTADDRTRTAGKRISELGNQGLTELRRILALLDTPSAVRPHEPAVHADESVRGLVEQARAAGQDVDLDVPASLPALAPATASAVTRTVQEGLTNARRHAPGSVVRVGLEVAGGAVRVEVHNGPATGPVDGAGTGRGLAAMRRRIDLLGGRVDHAETEEGGYALRVELPT